MNVFNPDIDSDVAAAAIKTSSLINLSTNDERKLKKYCYITPVGGKQTVKCI